MSFESSLISGTKLSEKEGKYMQKYSITTFTLVLAVSKMGVFIYSASIWEHL